MSKIKHLDVIEWPNGLGCTPCSIEYRNLHDEQVRIHNPAIDGANIEKLSPEDYQQWMTLDNKLLELQAAGHLGKSVRY